MSDFTSILIYGSHTMKDAMKKLDETAEKALFVINENQQLTGAITDGDIRRAILRGEGFDRDVHTIMNKDPKYITIGDELEERAKAIMLENIIEALPVINENRQVVDVFLWKNFFRKKKALEYQKRANKVFILAGGVGSRLEPFTRVLPKPLIPLGEKPIIENIMDRFLKYGFDRFVISLNFKAEMIKLYLSSPEIEEKYTEVAYVKEDKPLGTIGSLCLAAQSLNETFYITNSDILVEEDMDKIFRFHKEKGNILTIVGCVKNSVIPYGVLVSNDEGHLVKIDEKPEYKHVINTGIYIAEPEILQYVKPDEKFDMTELIDKLISDQRKISIYPVFDEQWFDIGQWSEYERTRKHFEG